MGNAITALFVGAGGGFLAGIMIGALLLAGFGYLQSGGVNVPYAQDHVAIANKFSIFDSSEHVALSLKHVQTSTFVYPQTTYRGLLVFEKGETYTQSLWVWCRDNDIQVVMTIIGPSLGNYSVEFGRQSWSSMQISGAGLSVSWAGGGGSEGYAWVEVKS